MKKTLLLFILLTSSALALGNPAASSPLSSVFDQIAQQAESGKFALAGAPVSDKLLTYKPSSKVSAEIRNIFVNGLIAEGKKRGTLTAATEKQLRDGFSKVDIAAEYKKALAPKGFDVYNVVTAMTVYVVSSFEIVDDLQTTDAMDKATYNQLKSAFAKVDAIAKMGNAEKQKFAEGLMWLSAFQVNDLEQAKNGTKGYTLENVKESVKTTLKSFKINPDSVQVGAKGLEARD